MPAVARIDPKSIFTPEEWAGLAKRMQIAPGYVAVLRQAAPA